MKSSHLIASLEKLLGSGFLVWNLFGSEFYAESETKTSLTQAQPKPRVGFKPTVLKVEAFSWFLDLLRLRFFVSQCRRNSAIDKVIGKKQIKRRHM